MVLGVFWLAGNAALTAGGKKKDEPALPPQMQPGPEHKQLASYAGNWNIKAKFWMSPDAKPEDSEGVVTRTVILDGRYLQETFKGKAGGMEFTGIGVWGYDNLRKHYFSTWIDSMGTGLMHSTGSYDASKTTYTFHSDDIDPFSGKKMKTRVLVRVVSDDHQVMEMFSTPEGGKEFRMMELHYTRAPKKKNQ
jgi:hypothetical protein